MTAMKMRVCRRCGVEYDGTDYLAGAPCLDCQYDVEEPDEGWLAPKALRRLQDEEFNRRTELIVRRLYAEGYNDNQIGLRIGYSQSWVSAFRRSLNLDIQPDPVNDRIDPIVADQRAKYRKAMQKYDYTTRSYVYKNEPTRVEHAANRLMYGWPEERAYWQERDMKEAKERTVQSWYNNA